METGTTEFKGLKSNVIGLVGAVTLGVVMLSPAMTIYANFGPSFLAAEKAAPLIFVWALIATLPTAISYVLLSNKYPHSGSAAHWIKRTGLHKLARWAGWMVFFYYLTNFIIQPIDAGVFLNDFLKSAGYEPNIYTYIVGVLSCCAWTAWIVYRGISLSIKGALVFLLFESVVVSALCMTVFFVAPHHGVQFTTEGFHMNASPTGFSGLFRGLIFGMLSFCGFDVISTLAEETKMPGKLIPRATMIALALFGALIVVSIWVLTYADTSEHLKIISDAGGMPISEIARVYWGKGAVFVSITAITSALGIAIATAIGSSRVLMSMSREGDAAKTYSKLHSTYQVPWSAMHLIFGLGVSASIVTALFLGPYQTFVWWGTTSTFFAMLTYLIVNIANIILFRSIIFKNANSFFLHAVIPVIGIVLDGYILIESFFIELWKQGWATGQSVIVFDLLCAILGVVFAFRK